MVERIKFTKKELKALEAPRTGRRYVYDSEVRNLALCLTSNGARSWYRCGRVHGQPQRIRIGSAEEFTIGQAREECRRLTGEIADRKNPMESRRARRGEKTIQELFDWVLENHSKPNKKTWKRDKAEYEQKVKHWGSRRITSLTTAEIREHHTKLKNTLGPYAANKMREILRLMYSIAMDNGWVDHNPVNSVPRAKTRDRERFLNADEIIRWFKAVANIKRETTRDFFLIALYTGARRDNVCSMRWDEIDFDHCIWTIPGKKFKNGDPVSIVLVEQTMEILNRRKDESESEWVFPGGGRTGHLVEPKAAWRKICIEAGLAEMEYYPDGRVKTATNMVRIHDLRRTLGSWQAAGGASLQVIGKSLGQKSLSATQIYARLQLDPIRESVAAAVNAIESASKKK